MTAAVLNLTGNFIIEQGSYWELTLSYPGNQINAYLRGQIRKGYNGVVLAEFRYDAPDFNEEEDYTTFKLFLNATQTLKLPIPEEGEEWRYDVLFFDGVNDPIRLLQGSVDLSLGVTK